VLSVEGDRSCSSAGHCRRQRLRPAVQRHVILASPLRDLTGFALVTDCRGPSAGGAAGAPTQSLALGACYGDRVTLANVLQQMRCGRGGRPLAFGGQVRRLHLRSLASLADGRTA
jgi:hypothetical protein